MTLKLPSSFKKVFLPQLCALRLVFEEEMLLLTPKPLGQILPPLVLTSGPTFFFLCLISLKSLALPDVGGCSVEESYFEEDLESCNVLDRSSVRT
ncbi:hypothetical protein MTR_7g070410 [Medicago truncatula]|uniref:Uncharacterized protein n=1 Tax=Medicago truncatula TaxID=3880 RepID=G7KU40_MEDTR|nr:hypothetical protein MTR_7g070410 [Medicago truncatula]